MSADSRSASPAQARAMVMRLADTAEQVAAGLRALLEPEAAALVARLASDASAAAAVLGDLLETGPGRVDWYLVHRELWIRYGDLADLAAMADNITEAS